MSEEAKFVALGEAINEAFNNFRDASTAWTDAYEYGYKAGWKDALEHAKTLRDPDRLTDCDQCGYRHPATRDHCQTCGSASLFPHGVHRDHRTFNI